MTTVLRKSETLPRRPIPVQSVKVVVEDGIRATDTLPRRPLPIPVKVTIEGGNKKTVVLTGAELTAELERAALEDLQWWAARNPKVPALVKKVLAASRRAVKRKENRK